MPEPTSMDQFYLQQSLESSRLQCLSIASQVCAEQGAERVLAVAKTFAEFVGAWNDAEKRLAG